MDAEQVMFQVRQENIQLKKRINEQEEKVKRLGTKNQRLTEDLKRNLAASQHVPAKDVIRNIQNDDLLDDLKTQIRDLAKTNGQLKNKMLQYKSLAEAGASKKGSAGGRVSYQAPLKPSVAKHVHDPNAVELERFQASQDEVQRLQALVNVMREKLEQTDVSYEELQREHSLLKTSKTSEVESALLKSDVERIALQKELQAKNKEIGNLQSTLKQVQGELYKADAASKRVALDAEELATSLKEEKRARVDAEKRLLSGMTNGTSYADLNEIIKDLRGEKDLLEKEMSRLLAVSLNGQSRVEHDKEVAELKQRIHDLQLEGEKAVERERELIQKLDAITNDFSQTDSAFRSKQTEYYALKQKYDEVNDKMSFFIKEGIVDLSEIEEALAIVKTSRERGIRATLDFLTAADESFEDKETLEQLRQDHVRVIQDLDRCQKLLAAQEAITNDHKAEIQNLQKQIDKTKNRYESRLEESARLLDVRQNKIGKLEAKLQEIVNGTVTLRPSANQLAAFRGLDDFAEDVVLGKGQNILEIQILKAEFNAAGVAHLHERLRSSQLVRQKSTSSLSASKSCDLADPENHLTTFVTFDFFDFSTQVTPMSLGLRPQYNFISRFTVTIDDFFLEYLATRHMNLDVWRSVGGEFASIGWSRLSFHDLIEAASMEDPAQAASDALQEGIHYITDIYEKDGSNDLLGKISYSIRARLPMTESIRAYRERNAALNLLHAEERDGATMVESTVREQNPSGAASLYQKSEKAESAGDFKSVGTRSAAQSSADVAKLKTRYERNELVINLLRLDGLTVDKQTTGVFATFQLYRYGDFVTDTRQVASHATTQSVTLNSQIKVPVNVSGDFDRYLRSSNVDIQVFADDKRTDDIKLLGTARIPLSILARGETVRGSYTVEGGSGSLILSMQWAKPYALNITPVVSLMEASKSRESAKRAIAVAKPETIVETAEVQAPMFAGAQEPVAVAETKGTAPEKAQAVAPLFAPVQETLSMATSKPDTSNKAKEVYVTSAIAQDTSSLVAGKPAYEPAPTYEPSAVDEVEQRYFESVDSVAQPEVPSTSTAAALTFGIDSVMFATVDDDVVEWLADKVQVRQFFVSFEFLDEPAENLESASIGFALGQEIPVGFSAGLPLDKVQQWYKSDSSIVTFNVVSEPPDDQPAVNGVPPRCVDFATASFNLRNFFKQNEAKEGQTTVDLPLYAIDNAGELKSKESLGQLTLSVCGSSSIHDRTVDGSIQNPIMLLRHPLSSSNRSLARSGTNLPITGSYARLAGASPVAERSAPVEPLPRLVRAASSEDAPRDPIDELVDNMLEEQ